MHLNKAVSLATKIIWDAIDEVVVAARQGMAFIKAITTDAVKQGLYLTWETPSGFIAEQKRYEMKSTRVRTQLLGETKFTVLEPTTTLDLPKMVSSCAPNFIHSHDAAHLVNTIVAAYDAGIRDIVVIHDSFGTHACNTDLLRDTLRSELVSMYSGNRMEAFIIDLMRRQGYEWSDGIEMPSMGDLDLTVILDSEYVFA